MITQLAVATQVAIAAVLGSAGLSKVRRPRSFVTALRDYDLLPAPLVVPFAVLLPCIELLSASLVLIRPARHVGSVAMLALLTSFTLAVSLVLLRGRRDIGCACFGRASRSLTWMLPTRNALLIGLLAAAVATDDGSQAVTASAVVTAALGLIITITSEQFRLMLVQTQAKSADVPALGGTE